MVHIVSGCLYILMTADDIQVSDQLIRIETFYSSVREYGILQVYQYYQDKHIIEVNFLILPFTNPKSQ